MKYLAVVISFAFASFNAQATDISTVLGVLPVPTAQSYSQVHTVFELGSTFYDDYTFSVTDSVANSITSSVSFSNFFGITGLSARLYSGSSHITGVAGSFLEQGWSTPISFDPQTTQSTVVLGAHALAAGTYTLQIKGTVSGQGGGSYAGVLNIVAVPEADTYAMLIAGLGVMGAIARRKSSKV